MINGILKAMGAALNAEFGDRYTVIMEENMQELNEPCFFISCINTSVRLFPGRRYFRNNQFCIQYFPETGRINEECSGVAERLFSCMEYVSASGDLMRGASMQYKIANGMLCFFVNYDCFVRKTGEFLPMESIGIAEYAKG